MQNAAEANVCFVISPFGGYFDQYYEVVFGPAIEAAGLTPRRADDLFMSSDIVRDVWGLVTTCRVMIADLTGKNPNVFYELGLAHAARKPVLLLTQTIQDVPFDLRSLRVIVYDVQHPAWGEVLRLKIGQGLGEALSAPQRWVLPTFLLEHAQQQPSVSSDEKRVLELQQQIDVLRAEIQSLSSSLPVWGYGNSPAFSGFTRSAVGYSTFDSASLTPEPTFSETLSRKEAEAMIAQGVRTGVRSSSIVETLKRYGQDEAWVRAEINRISAMSPLQRDNAYPPKGKPAS